MSMVWIMAMAVLVSSLVGTMLGTMVGLVLGGKIFVGLVKKMMEEGDGDGN